MNEITATTYFVVMVKRKLIDESFVYCRMHNHITDDIKEAAKFHHINDAKQFRYKLKNKVKDIKIVKAVTTMDIRDV